MTEKKHAIKPYPLGAHVEDGVIRFAYASGKKDCGIILYDRKSGKKLHRIPFSQDERMGNVYCKYLELDPEEIGYQFYEADAPVQDLHAQGFFRKPAYGKVRKNADRIAIFPGEDFDWGQDVRPMLSYAESVCYCLHVRGFTMHASAGVKHRGTFAGVVEKLDYLQEIGVTTVEFQPVYEFDETPEEITPKTSGELAAVAGEKDKGDRQPGYRVLNYWGYREGFYYAPKAAYAAGESPSEELRSMVKEFHKRKMEVILQFYFPKGMDAAEIGNILRFWVLSYHVDGFHLMGEVPAQALAKDPALSTTKLWYYAFDTSELYDPAVKPEYRNMAEYRDDYLYTMRRYLKGDDNMLSGVLYEMRHIPANMGRIHYLSNYYGLTLMDMVSYDHKHNEANGEGNRDGNDYNCSWNCGEEGPSRRRKVLALRKKQLQNAFCMLLLTQSTPLIFMGDEFGNSQQGNNNPYCQDNKTTWLNWQDREKNAELLAFWKQMTAFRKAHPILHPQEELRILDTLSCGYPDLSYHGQNAWKPQTESYNRHVGMMYCGKYAVTPQGTEDAFLYVAMNMHWEPQKLAFPKLPKGMEWKLVLATEMAEETLTVQEKEEQSREQTGTIAPRSIAVYEGVAAMPQEKGKRVSTRSGKRERTLPEKDDRTK